MGRLWRRGGGFFTYRFFMLVVMFVDLVEGDGGWGKE